MVAINALLLSASLAASALASGASHVHDAKNYLTIANAGIRNVQKGGAVPNAEGYITVTETQVKDINSAISQDKNENRATPDCDALAEQFRKYSDLLDKFAPSFAGIACDQRFAKVEDRARITNAFRGLRTALEGLAQQSASFCPNTQDFRNRFLSNTADLDEIIGAYEPIQLNCVL